MQDKIICFSNADEAYIILNGEIVKYGIEHSFEIGEVLPELFAKLQYSYNKPIVIDLYQEDYFNYDEVAKLWARENRIGRTFTDEELDILDGLLTIQAFVDKVKEDIKDEEVDLDD